MHSQGTNARTRSTFNTSSVQPAGGSSKPEGVAVRRALSRALISALLLVAVSPTWAQTKKVNANAEVSGAGYKSITTSDGSGILPAKIQLPADATTMVFAITGGSKTKGRCTAPCITVNGGGSYNDADGVGSASGENVSADQAISGIQTPTAGFVAGVFESGAPAGNPPATLDYNTIGTNFSSFSPLMQQLFFIGDGLTGDGTGTVQVFYVPTGAKSLYLGLADACGYNGTPSCYGDNSGDFIVSYAISTASGLPEITHFSPTVSKVGKAVEIWGYNLLTATAVNFNGVPASFTVESTLIKAVVPVGAATGPIEVTTPDGTAQSKGDFTVKP
jgi:hypothetical protein